MCQESGVVSSAPRYKGTMEIDLNRAASLTKEEEQITFSWSGITVKTRASSGRSMFRKSEPIPSKTLVDNSKT